MEFGWLWVDFWMKLVLKWKGNFVGKLREKTEMLARRFGKNILIMFWKILEWEKILKVFVTFRKFWKRFGKKFRIEIRKFVKILGKILEIVWKIFWRTESRKKFWKCDLKIFWWKCGCLMKRKDFFKVLKMEMLILVENPRI